MLGERVDPKWIVQDSSDVEDVEAAVLASILADPQSAWDSVDGLDQIAVGPAQSVTSTALARIEDGFLVSAIE